MFNLCQIIQFFYRSTFSQGFIHNELSLTCRNIKHIQKLFLRFRSKILCPSKSITSCFQASDCFLECFFICLTNRHNFTNSTHLCTKLVIYTFKFLKCPTSKFDYNIISVRYIFVQCSVFTTRNLI